jgi:hypothetical protein
LSCFMMIRTHESMTGGPCFFLSLLTRPCQMKLEQHRTLLNISQWTLTYIVRGISSQGSRAYGMDADDLVQLPVVLWDHLYIRLMSYVPLRVISTTPSICTTWGTHQPSSLLDYVARPDQLQEVVNCQVICSRLHHRWSRRLGPRCRKIKSIT